MLACGDSDGNRLLAQPNWSHLPPLRMLLEEWVRSAHDLAGDELVLLVDPNFVELDLVVQNVESMLHELGLDAESAPDISIEATAELIG